jgi:hypothetical protein
VQKSQCDGQLYGEALTSSELKCLFSERAEPTVKALFEALWA